ncbi:hypothetical protein AB0M43_34000 [Longispora sp. NPDC051575]|uniref:hypothetical protein n=1 Tax=Longispora sp. NPDC051575 TaxID=3154943 RepID=UPI00343BE674
MITTRAAAFAAFLVLSLWSGGALASDVVSAPAGVGAGVGVAPASGEAPSEGPVLGQGAAPVEPGLGPVEPGLGPQASGSCDFNYGGCVPVATDVDCAGGPGNGPAYVQGPVAVIGTDVYGLDGDNDGIGCEEG